MKNIEPIPDDKYVDDVCKVGQGASCCRYLTVVPVVGWSCLKFSELKVEIDHRVAEGKMKARGDNCEGKAPP